MITPATTGSTKTRAAVAMLRWERSGSMAAPRPTDRATPTIEPTRRLRTAPLSYESRPPAPGPEPVEDFIQDLRPTVKNLLRAIGQILVPWQISSQCSASSASSLVMLGLIWALDRV